MRQNDPKSQILGQVWVLESSVDCEKGSGVVPEQFQVVLGMFDAFSIFSTRFTVKNRTVPVKNGI